MGIFDNISRPTMGIFDNFSLTVKGAGEGSSKDVLLVNDDIRPLKLEDRTWTRLTYLTFWFSATATVGNW